MAPAMEEDVVVNKHNKSNNGGPAGSSVVHFFFVISVVLCVLLYALRVSVHSPYRTADFIVAASSSPQARTNNHPAASSAAHDAAGSNNSINAVPPAVPVVALLDNQVGSPCSTMRNNTICCDRSDFNTDVCFMAGDVRTDAASLSLQLLFLPPAHPHQLIRPEEEQEERIRPYTRKWERFLMHNIPEVRLRSHSSRPVSTQLLPDDDHHRRCDVRHDAPLLVMTAGGYTGNLFHAFSDGFLPAWLTVQHLRRRVVLGVLSYNPWWAGTFSHIISGLSGYDVVDMLHDKRTHCFPGAIVGTRFHGILTVDPARLRDNKTIVDFHRFLADAYQRSKKPADPEEEEETMRRRPRLGIVSRKGTRVMENEAAVARLAESVGFDVDVLETANGMPLSAVYAAVSACDALVGVHGADLTKFLFLRPGHASLTQISPLGVSPIARDCFGKPAARMGLHYEQYEVRVQESSLCRRYALDDVVLADPEAAKRKGGWNLVAKVYLGGQNVTLDLGRFRDTLVRMHARALLL